jgi:hypothetical protein
MLPSATYRHVRKKDDRENNRSQEQESRQRRENTGKQKVMKPPANADLDAI